MKKRPGMSYKKRVIDINRIYDEHARDGLSNREIWRRYIYPIYAISECTFYNILNAAAKINTSSAASDMPGLFDCLPEEPTDKQKI